MRTEEQKRGWNGAEKGCREVGYFDIFFKTFILSPAPLGYLFNLLTPGFMQFGQTFDFFSHYFSHVCLQIFIGSSTNSSTTSSLHKVKPPSITHNLLIPHNLTAQEYPGGSTQSCVCSFTHVDQDFCSPSPTKLGALWGCWRVGENITELVLHHAYCWWKWGMIRTTYEAWKDIMPLRCVALVWFPT